MLAKKNRNRGGAIIFLLLAVFIAGCTPPGPRELAKGRKLLARGDYAGAVTEFKAATTLMATNAQAWNYLGVACQHAGQPADAAAAYQRALALDRDLVEAHYNLGSLWLEQNKPADAKTEFTAYTLRRGNDPAGWLKLGSAQLHAGEFLTAEKSFSTALYLNTNNSEALNGLGLARAERGRAREAAQFFAAAVQYHPEFAAAYLNLATVAHQDLHDNQLALQNYRTYLALTPRPANWDAVNELVKNLAAPPPADAATSPPNNVKPMPAVNEPKLPPSVHAPTTSKSSPAVSHSTSAGRPSQPVNLTPDQEIVTQTPKAGGAAVTATGTNPPPGQPSPGNQPAQKYFQTGVTPLPPLNSSSPTGSNGSAPPVAAKPAPVVPPPAPTFPRYPYLSPRKPATGDHPAAAGQFAQAQKFEQGSRWSDALQAYRQAANLDPGWFEAQYNFGATAYRLKDFSTALAAYEMALAIKPDSSDARYNFALALKASDYVTDALNELKKIVAASPGDVRAQLALGNLYAQQMHEPAKARPCYLKVLELDPRNPSANDIRFWLSANPG